MKRKLQLILLLCFAIPNLIKAQESKYIVFGKVDSQCVNSYAFLYLPERKLTIHQPIVNLTFKFIVDKKLKFETVMLYFGKDSTKTYNDIQSDRRFGVKDIVLVALEDSVYISVNNDLNTVKVVGRNLNRDLMEMGDAIKSGNYLDFFSSHSDSQVSLLFLRSLARVNKRLIFDQLIDCELYYSKLSEGLKKSPEGLVVWNMISK